MQIPLTSAGYSFIRRLEYVDHWLALTSTTQETTIENLRFDDPLGHRIMISLLLSLRTSAPPQKTAQMQIVPISDMLSLQSLH